MQFRRIRLFSWSNGYDMKDHRNREFKLICARRIRKQEKESLRKELENEDDTPREGNGYRRISQLLGPLKGILWQAELRPMFIRIIRPKIKRRQWFELIAKLILEQSQNHLSI